LTLYSDGRFNYKKYEELEEQNRSKKNINQTYHLHHIGHLPTVAWESSLRDGPSKKLKKKPKDSESPAPK
jgi:hypothetical protein